MRTVLCDSVVLHFSWDLHTHTCPPALAQQVRACGGYMLSVALLALQGWERL